MKTFTSFEEVESALSLRRPLAHVRRVAVGRSDFAATAAEGDDDKESG